MLPAIAAAAMLSACSIVPDREEPAPQASPETANTADRNIIPRFENHIARSLLADADKLVPRTDSPFRKTADVALDYAATAQALQRSVEFQHLYPDTRLIAEDFLIRAGHWQERSTHAVEFDRLRSWQHTAASVRGLFLPAESWSSFAARVTGFAAGSASTAAVSQPSLPPGWDSLLLPADLATAFARHRHELGIEPASAPFPGDIPAPPAAPAAALSAGAYAVLLLELGYAETPAALHELATMQVRTLLAQASHAAATNPTPQSDPNSQRQSRLSALASAIGKHLPRVHALAPSAGLPDLYIWRVEPSREAAAPALEYVAGRARGLPAVLYVNLAEVVPLQESVIQMLAAEVVLGHHLAAAWGFAHAAGWAAFITRPAGSDLTTQHAWHVRELERWVWLAVDSGLHSGAWSKAEAVDFAAQATGLPATVAEHEVTAIGNYPGAAAAFLPTRRVLDTWWSERGQLPDGDAGDEFIRRVLRSGQVSPTSLRRALELEFATVEQSVAN